LVDLDPRVDFDLMIEWWAGLDWGLDADAFLATQGDVWDTQWDMFLAMIGAVRAQLLLDKLHDRQFQAFRRAASITGYLDLHQSSPPMKPSRCNRLVKRLKIATYSVTVAMM